MKKKIFASILTFLPVFLMAQTVSIQPDLFLHDDSFSYGDNKSVPAFFNYQGNMLMFNYQKVTDASGSSPELNCVYMFNTQKGDWEPLTWEKDGKNYNYIEFGFDGEDGYNNYHRCGVTLTVLHTFAFEFNQQLWFYMLIKSSYAISLHDYVECYARWADDNSGWVTYTNMFHDQPLKTKRGALQADTSLYFLCFVDNDKEIYYKTWWYYRFCQNPTNDHLFYTGDSCGINYLEGASLGGMFTVFDTLNHPYTYINTFDPKGNCYLGYLDSAFRYTSVHNGLYPNCAASTIVQGSIQGKRTAAPDQPADRNRYALFIIGTKKNSDGHYPVTYHERLYDLNKTAFDDSGTVVLPTSTTPKDVNSNFQIAGTFDLNPKHFTNYMGSENDGFQQEAWFFYPDSKKKLNGACFHSDLWRPIPGSAVSSIDLGNDSLYGPEVTSLWSLTGIVDGAPPCSIDWEVWNQTHEVDPTELSFTTTDVSKSEVTNAYENEFSLGYEIKTGMGKKGGPGFNTKFKFSTAFLSKISSGNTIATELKKTFPLNEESQEYGAFLYTVPAMTRISYQVYPWWDSELVYPIPNTLQYLFRTTGTVLTTSPRAISEFPFQIDEPNATNLADWQPDHRTLLWDDIINAGIQSVASMNWHTPDAGDLGTFEEVTDSTTMQTQKTSYEMEVSPTFSIPEVFEIGLSYGSKISYESELKAETEIGHKAEASLQNLTEESLGVNFPAYTVFMYWLRPEDYNWWFYDSLNGQKPWYISYIVSFNQGKIIPLSPEAGYQTKSTEMVFSWLAEDADIREYSLFIGSASYITPSTTVYRKLLEKETFAMIPENILERGKTYYWSVRGITESKDILWSESRAFSIQGELPALVDDDHLQATVYPNPAGADLVRVLAISDDPGEITFELYSFNGRLLERKTAVQEDADPVSVEFNAFSLIEGIYVVEIHSATDNIARKLVVSR